MSSLTGPMLMKITLRLCLKWTMLVTLSAIASFVAALLTDHTGTVKIAAMLTGIATFIGIYVLIEAWAQSRNMEGFLKSLKVGVIIKIALQLIPAIEIFTGMFVVYVIDFLHIPGDFSTTYLKTIAVGTILSGAVFVIASVYWYIHNRFGKRTVPMD